MKKKSLIGVFVFLLIIPIYASELKRYTDWNNGYTGYAGADYIGTTKTINPKTFSMEAEQRIRNLGVYITRYCQKLSNQERYLLWSALGMYNYTDNEIYSVTIQQGKEILQLVVVITNGGSSCNWYGGWYVWDPT